MALPHVLPWGPCPPSPSAQQHQHLLYWCRGAFLVIVRHFEIGRYKVLEVSVVT